MEESRGQSIDLALSVRGREALRHVELEDTLVNHHGIAMRGRMLHGRDGKLNEMIYDSVGNNVRSISTPSNIQKKIFLTLQKKNTMVEKKL